MNTLINKFGIGRIKGWKSWTVFGSILALMCIDQFGLNIPFENLVFPALALAAVILSPLQAILLAVIYGLIFELYGCFGYYGPMTVVPWTAQVVLGFLAPVVISLFSRKNSSVAKLTIAATLGELVFYWTSIVMTIILWKVEPVSYILSDLPFEFMGCAMTAVCSLCVFTPIQLLTETKKENLIKDLFVQA